MSKLRQAPPTPKGDLSPPGHDMRAYVVFTQLNDKVPHVYAGWLDAPDDHVALNFAREHYGRDQECVSLWLAPREFVAGMRINAEASAEPVAEREYRLFTQKESGDQHREATVVRADCAARALEIARRELPNAAELHSIWAIPVVEIIATAPGEMIWRTTDQTYRLARGYSRTVREKWEQIREEKALREYEKSDLTEAF